ncbi:formate-dependent phosphoribosylglycinamide formyltransferase [Alphaproteobacteria bacterium]|jgi:phosphoribosylglycinamide formyltransferase 2|nr:formate-dependent phosphoribosylglycinamide formyltransferase [Alphaproteobacteria bacterium]MDB9870042.1 formate-dependent phosphoribosylglycinamide formyltransferase [Alphaproteobacteria bacterium]|tara:strand:- start:1023 stop:2165 length:1143 start_codon:yes stop_codon:yes gene_type:complete
MKKILLLGSGELGKELTISLKRMGYYVIACDAYENAPAMQVSDVSEVFNMLDRDKLKSIIDRYKPNFIVPEVEAIQTEVLIEVEKDGYTVIPSAKAVNLTMNRDKIRDRAKSLGLKTANYAYAETEEALILEAKKIGSKVAIKPVMSSSGKGQSYASSEDEVKKAWKFAIDGMRGNRQRVIVEEFIDFDYEITLLTILEKNGKVSFCKPIGHYQKRGDYQYSWQPAKCSKKVIQDAQDAARKMVLDLGGSGIFGVEFFITKSDKVIFSELSPRPHDTGMVTMYTQNYSQFDIHARALTGMPLPEIKLLQPGASHVILANENASGDFFIEGIEDALTDTSVDYRIFGKPVLKSYRRMGVVLADTLENAKKAANKIKVSQKL